MLLLLDVDVDVVDIVVVAVVVAAAAVVAIGGDVGGGGIDNLVVVVVVVVVDAVDVVVDNNGVVVIVVQWLLFLLLPDLKFLTLINDNDIHSSWRISMIKAWCMQCALKHHVLSKAQMSLIQLELDSGSDSCQQ